ncbi:hypothetical protein ABZP36_010194, partial [Zizania latifolia]
TMSNTEPMSTTPVSLGLVVAGAGLAEDEVVGAEDLAVGSRAHRVHGAWLDVHQHGAGNEVAAARLVVGDVDALKQVRVARILTSVVDAVLVADHLPNLGPDLVAALAVGGSISCRQRGESPREGVLSEKRWWLCKNVESPPLARTIKMARAVLIAVVALCAVVAVAHAGRAPREEEAWDDGGGFEAPQLQPSASPYATLGGSLKARGRSWYDGGGGGIVDVLWYVFRSANYAVAAAGGGMNDR